MKRQVRALIVLAVGLGLAAGAWGQPSQAQRGGFPPQGAAGQQAGTPGLYNFDASTATGIPMPDVKPSETRQKVVAGGEALAYTARAGYVPLRNATTGQPEAYLFFTSYTKDAPGDPAARPLIVFLGGAPGVSTAFQEFGGLGPKRMKWAADGSPGPPPYGWVDNPDTLLGLADLVFVNPVGTAYSRPVPPNRGPAFWNTSGDTDSLSEFVRGYLNAYDRRSSPLYLAAEDFGTGRAASVAVSLQDRQIPVTGVILLSMQPAADATAGDAQCLTLLPSLTLAAWAHKKLPPDLQALGAAEVAERARQFASREYLHALYQGDRMTAEEKAKVTDDLARLTGLPKAFLVSNNLRPAVDRFAAELLRGERRSLSLQDSRVAGFASASAGLRGGFAGFGGAFAAPAVDYRLGEIAGPFLAAYESYLRRELGFTASAGVFYLTRGGIGTFTSTGSDEAGLANAFVRNPRLRLFVAAGAFDLQAPFYAVEYTVAQLGVSPGARAGGISLGLYESGQMPYLDAASRARLRADLAAFTGAAAAPPPPPGAAGGAKEK